MKKLFTLAAMMLLTITAGAQTLDGTWKFNEEASESMSMLVKSQVPEEVDMKVSAGIKFSEDKLDFLIWTTIGAEGTNMEIQMVIPGTYTKDGDQVTCEFNADKFDFDITDIKSDSPEMTAMMADPASKAMLLMMIKQQMKQSLSEAKDGFALIANTFKSFKVKDVTDTQLTITLGESDMTLERI